MLTNAAGGINASFRVGQPVLISDHLNLTGRSPLFGPPPPDGYPQRFADLTEVYSARLRALARASDPGLAEGIYAALPGPHYETPAEIRMLRTLGADLVGMSTVLEAIAARHLGAEVLGISLVTNLAAGLADRARPRRSHRGRGGGSGPDRRPARQHPAAGRARMSGTRDPRRPARPGGCPDPRDPDPGDQAELQALLAAGEQGATPGGPRWPGSPTASPAACSSARPGCAARWAPGRTG